MTSAEFEKQAKKAVAGALGAAVGIEGEDLETVWFAHVMGFKKCLLYCPELPNCYFEVTYNRDRAQMYVDVYNKAKNIRLDRVGSGEFVETAFSKYGGA